MTRRVELGPRWRALSTRTRHVTLAGIGLIAVATAVVWMLVPNDNLASPATDAGAMGAMDGMSGMRGMNTSTAGSVQLTASQIQQFGITFGTSEIRRLEDEVRTVGLVRFDETRMAQVAPKFGGFVERLYVDFTGQPVRVGQPLFDIYSPELVAAQEELLVAQRLERTMNESMVPGVPGGTTDLVAAARQRLSLWGISEEQIEDIARTGEVRRRLTLHAPVSGVVVEKHVVLGQAVQSGQTLYTIADMSELWIDVELREHQIPGVREGSAATIELTALRGRPLNGRVEYVYPTLQEETRTVKARIAVANTRRLLKPGMYATVRIATPSYTALTVPSSSVLRTGERALVFVDTRTGSLVPQEIEIGRVAGDYTEVLTGIEPGQRVVTSAQFLLDSESNLAEVMRAMMGQVGVSDMDAMEMGDRPEMDTGGSGSKGAKTNGMAMPPGSDSTNR